MFKRFSIVIICILVLFVNTTFVFAFTVNSFSKTTPKNTTIAFTTSNFTDNYSDTEEPPKTLESIKIKTLPDTNAGVLKLIDTIVTVDETIPIANTDTLKFEPKQDFVGTANFTFSAMSGTSETAPATVTLTIEDVDTTMPLAQNLSITTEKNKPFSGTLTGTDPENRPLTFSITTNPTNGTVTITNTGTGAFTYTPNNNYVGQDSFLFKVSNGIKDSLPATVSITVTAPEPPQIEPLRYEDLVDHWASYSAGMLGSLGLIVGDKIQGKYYFYPDRLMTRADFILFLTAALGIPAAPDAPSVFDDEALPYFIIGPSNAAFEQGIVNGVQVGDKKYLRPYDVITRVEAVKMIDNALKVVPDNDNGLTFADKDTIPSWGVGAFKNLIALAIVRGFDDNTVRSYQKITRAQAGEMVYQVYKYKTLPQTTSNAKIKTILNIFGL